MRKSTCCKAPATTHGARRRLCVRCGRSWTIRPKRRGRKKKRARVAVARQILEGRSSLRGLAKIREVGRETLRRRFHRSAIVWQKGCSLSQTQRRGSLIAVVDALWFRIGKKRRPYTCYVILLRPVNQLRAVVKSITLREGKESKAGWRSVFDELPQTTRSRICAVVGDGIGGLAHLANEHHWYFQWCHAHMKRRVAELRGVRNLPGKSIRQRVFMLVNQFLEVASEKQTQANIQELRYLFSLSECPRSLKYRLSALMIRQHFFRTYRQVPKFNLPVTTNSAEQVNNQIRSVLKNVRGLRSVSSLKYWLALIHRTIKPIKCRGYKETI